MKAEEIKKLSPEQLLEVAISLHGQNETIKAENTELKAQLEEAADQYAALSKKLDRAEQNAKGGVKVFGEVKVGRITYDIVRPKTNYKGRIYLAKEIEADTDLAAQLVKIGAGCLREQTKE